MTEKIKTLIWWNKYPNSTDAWNLYKDSEYDYNTLKGHIVRLKSAISEADRVYLADEARKSGKEWKTHEQKLFNKNIIFEISCNEPLPGYTSHMTKLKRNYDWASTIENSLRNEN